MDLTRFRYLLLVFLVLSGRPSFGQEVVERSISDYPVSVVFLSQYIQVPSVTGSEKAAGEFLANACREMGLHVRLFTEETDSYNLAASLYPLEMGKPESKFRTWFGSFPRLSRKGTDAGHQCHFKYESKTGEDPAGT